MLRALTIALTVLAIGCIDGPTAPAATPLQPWDGELVNAKPSGENCTFERGVNTCTTTSETTETEIREVFSGCIAGPPPFAPGRRVTTWEDTYAVTTTTTTRQHGRNGRVFEESTTTERTLVSSRQLSTVCEKL
jgi:hypothetical protein